MKALLSVLPLFLITESALAGAGGMAPIPAPVLGAMGPAGLAVAAVGYVAYKLYQRRS